MGKFAAKGKTPGAGSGWQDGGGGGGPPGPVEVVAHGKEQGGKSKRKEYNGLQFLDRGNADYQSQKKAKLWADKKHADKKRAQLNRLLGEMPESEKKPISGVFDLEGKTKVAKQPNPHALHDLDALEDSGSSSDCSLSDEEVDGMDIVFKDDSLQKVWDPNSITPRALANQHSKGGKDGGKAGGKRSGSIEDKKEAKRKTEGPAAIGSFMDVPAWDEEASGNEEGAKGGGEKKQKGGKRLKAALPDKVSFGNKARPEVLGALAMKAEAKKMQIEKERKEEQDKRCEMCCLQPPPTYSPKTPPTHFPSPRSPPPLYLSSLFARQHMRIDDDNKSELLLNPVLIFDFLHFDLRYRNVLSPLPCCASSPLFHLPQPP